MPIELTPDEFRQLGSQAVEIIARQLEAIRDLPVRQPVPERLRDEIMSQPLPRQGMEPEDLLARFVNEVQPYPMGNSSPRFMGWVNSTPAPLGMIAELLAAALDPSVAGGDHSATYVEHAVLNWMKEIMGYPRTAGGVLTSGGSAANLIGLGVMRHALTGGSDRTEGFTRAQPPMVVYTTSEGHSCIQKAVEILGFGSQYLRRIGVDAQFRMDLGALKAQIRADRQAGLKPACVAGSAGTVNTGAIDPLGAIADVCQEEGLWFHVDGSYGGVAILAEETEGLYEGIQRADSIATDQHKWMFMPIECGCALVKDAALMRDTFSLVPAYLRDDRGLPWFSEFGIQQTRGFRALKLWMVMQQVGIEAYRELIGANIRLARTLAAKIRASRDFEIMAEGPLSVVCFRYTPDGEKDVDGLNRRLLPALMNGGRAFLTSAEINGHFALRACIVNFRTTEDDLDEMLRAVIEAAKG